MSFADIFDQVMRGVTVALIICGAWWLFVGPPPASVVCGSFIGTSLATAQNLWRTYRGR